MRSHRKTSLYVSAIVCVSSLAAFAGNPVPTAFIYQGQLKYQGSPYTGDADLTFSLWDAMEGGREMASAVRARVRVSDGLFQAELDFGLEPFLRGGALWLEVAVDGRAGTVRLTPRQALTPTPFALRSLSAPDSGGTGLVLPYSGVADSAQTAFGVRQDGLARAGAFAINNAANTHPALNLVTLGSGPGVVSTTASGPAVWGRTGVGGGNAGYFETLGVDNTQPALAAENQASGPAAHFRTTKSENTNPVLFSESFSDGSAASFATHHDPNNANLAPTVASTHESFGSAGDFAIDNTSSTATALAAATNGGGNALHAKTGGTGRAGLFEVDNIGARTAPALEVVTNGRGGNAGLFRTTNGLNTAAALVAESRGSADAIRGVAAGRGTAVTGYNALGGNAVEGIVEASSGKAGRFTIAGGANADPALEAITNGSGPAARIESTAPNGTAAEFLGDVSIDGDLSVGDVVADGNLAAGSVSATGGVMADDYRYTTPQVHYLSLTPFDFTPNDDQVDWGREYGEHGSREPVRGPRARDWVIKTTWPRRSTCRKAPR